MTSLDCFICIIFYVFYYNMLKKIMQKYINLSPQKNSATVWLLALANGKTIY